MRKTKEKIPEIRQGYGKETLKLCDHIQLPNIDYDTNNPEYWDYVEIECRICNKIFIIKIGIN